MQALINEIYLSWPLNSDVYPIMYMELMDCSIDWSNKKSLIHIYKEVTTGNLIHDTILDVITSNTIGKKLFINMLNIKPLKEDMSIY